MIRGRGRGRVAGRGRGRGAGAGRSQEAQSAHQSHQPFQENVIVEDALSQSTVAPNNVQHEPVIQQILSFPLMNPVQQMIQPQVVQPVVQQSFGQFPAVQPPVVQQPVVQPVAHGVQQAGQGLQGVQAAPVDLTNIAATLQAMLGALGGQLVQPVGNAPPMVNVQPAVNVPPVVQAPPVVNAQPVVQGGVQVVNQAGQPNAPGVAQQTNRWLSLSAQIMKRCPREFRGTEGAVVAEEWLRDVRRHLDVMGCTPAEEVRLAAYRLFGKAQSWWSACVRDYGQEYVDAISWADFCELFEGKYVPDFERIKMKEQYETLTQGQMSVSDYYQRFDELSYYSTHETERDRVERFKKGLNPAIQHKVGSLRFDYVLDAVESTTMAESVCNRLRKDGDSFRKKGDSGNRFGNRSGNQNRDGQNQQSGNRNRGYQGNQNRNDRGNFGQAGKRQKVDRFEGNCFNCNRTGHRQVDCRFPGGGAYVPRDQNRQNDQRQGNNQQRGQNQNNQGQQNPNQNPRNPNNQPIGRNRVFALQAEQDGVEGDEQENLEI